MNLSNIETLRKEKNISQEKLANLIEMSKVGYQKAIQNGDLKVSTLVKIAEVLDVPVSYFFEYDKESAAKNLNIKQQINGSGNKFNNNNKIVINEMDALHKENEILKQQIVDLKKDKEFLQEMLRKKD